jgi:hypothetical protein
MNDPKFMILIAEMDSRAPVTVASGQEAQSPAGVIFLQACAAIIDMLKLIHSIFWRHKGLSHPE